MLRPLQPLRAIRRSFFGQTIRKASSTAAVSRQSLLSSLNPRHQRISPSPAAAFARPLSASTLLASRPPPPPSSSIVAAKPRARPYHSGRHRRYGRGRRSSLLYWVGAATVLWLFSGLIFGALKLALVGLFVGAVAFAVVRRALIADAARRFLQQARAPPPPTTSVDEEVARAADAFNRRIRRKAQSFGGIGLTPSASLFGAFATRLMTHAARLAATAADTRAALSDAERRRVERTLRRHALTLLATPPAAVRLAPAAHHGSAVSINGVERSTVAFYVYDDERGGVAVGEARLERGGRERARLHIEALQTRRRIEVTFADDDDDGDGDGTTLDDDKMGIYDAEFKEKKT